MFLKKLVQVALIRKTKFHGNLIDPLVAELQPVLYQPEFVMSNEMLHRFPALAFEISTQISIGNTKLFSDYRSL